MGAFPLGLQPVENRKPLGLMASMSPQAISDYFLEALRFY
jgi:hypothetical protein